MDKDSIILPMTEVFFSLLIKAHSDVINACAMKDQNHNEAQDPKDHIDDEWHYGNAQHGCL
jgi:hypothetical protein